MRNDMIFVDKIQKRKILSQKSYGYPQICGYVIMFILCLALTVENPRFSCIQSRISEPDCA